MTDGAPGAGPIHVLLIDDEPDLLESLSYWLTAKGYQVTTASSGPQGLEQLKQRRPDVIFLDVRMPGMDGIETLRRIRAMDKDIPVVLVTADSLTDESKYAGARALGISGLFPKGASLSQLGEVLEVALRRIRKAEDASPSPDASPRGPLGSVLSAVRSALARLTPPKR